MRAGAPFLHADRLGSNDAEVVAATQAQYDNLRSGPAGNMVREHFESCVAAFAKRQSSMNWRALKRAMLYLQAQSNRDGNLTPYFRTFRDEA